MSAKKQDDSAVVQNEKEGNSNKTPEKTKTEKPKLNGKSARSNGSSRKTANNSAPESKDPENTPRLDNSLLLDNSFPRFVLIFVVISFLFVAGLNYFSHVWRSSRDFKGNFKIELKTPAPAWIKSDVCAATEKKSPNLKQMSFDDPGLTEQVALAFKSNSVVSAVISVVKQFPDTISVDLEFRMPVAMVAVEGGYFPIDKQGVVLPTDNFVPANIHEYIRVLGIKSLPTHPIGAAWGDFRVETAAGIAEQLLPYQKDFGALEIVVHDQSAREQRQESCFDLRLENGAIIRWTQQYFNGIEVEQIADEISVKEKLELLRRAKQENQGTIKKEDGKMYFFEKNPQ